MIFFTDCDADKISKDRVNATWLSYPKQHNQTLQLMLLATLFGQLSQTGTHTGYAF